MQSTFDKAIDVTRARGIITIVALYDKPFQFEPMKLTASGVRIASSLGYEPEVFKNTIELMHTGQLDPTSAITDRIELENINKEGF